MLDADLAAFRGAPREDHTLKRALTDPGSSAASATPTRTRSCTARLSPRSASRLATRRSRGCSRRAGDADEWTSGCGARAAAFPEKVTAFREGMAVHGRYRQPCPVCGAPVQRIVYAENETNYCARCQTGGRLLADRALSRLLKDDWPRTLEELEEGRAER